MGDTVNVTFNNGTTSQQDLFTQAVAASLFPLDRVNIDVTVAFTSDPAPGLDHALAYTTINGEPLNECGRRSTGTITVLNGLEDETGGIVDPFRGLLMFRETVLHESGHVVAGWFTQTQIDRICVLFGGTPDDWNPSTPWATKIQEAFAETFKDIFLPRTQRRYDNRTNWRLPRPAYDPLLDIIDTICPCGGIEAG